MDVNEFWKTLAFIQINQLLTIGQGSGMQKCLNKIRNQRCSSIEQLFGEGGSNYPISNKKKIFEMSVAAKEL